MAFTDVLLRGIASKIFQFGPGGPKLIVIDPSSLEFTNALETAFARVKGADPIDPEDFVTLQFLMSIVSGFDNTIQTIRFPIGTAALQQSAHNLPSNALVIFMEVNIQAAYDLGTTIDIGQAGFPSLFMSAGENTPTMVGIYPKNQETNGLIVASKVDATIGGAPAAGSGFVTILYCPVPLN